MAIGRSLRPQIAVLNSDRTGTGGQRQWNKFVPTPVKTQVDDPNPEDEIITYIKTFYIKIFILII